MAAGTYPDTAMPELTDSQIKDIVTNLDTGLNNTIFNALLYGIYTGVVAVTLLAVASRDNCENRRRPHSILIAIILLLYLLTAFNLYGLWDASIRAFTTLAWKSVWQTYNLSQNPPPVVLTEDVAAILSTVLADATLIWRCWIVWGWSWRVVLVPIACTTLATVSRGIITYHYTAGPPVSPQVFVLEKVVNWTVLYASLIMATLLWCTILIIYRILRVGGAAGRIRVYQRVIEMLVGSAALYSAMLVALLVFDARNEATGDYIQNFVNVMRGMMPTIIVGRVAAGHARPDDSWSESTLGSSIRFGTHSTSQNETQMSVVSGRGTSLNERPDLEEGREDITQVRAERASPMESAYDYYHVIGTSSSVDNSAV
ncbi:hypothetical protein EDD18DRAFT_1440787 [Armillaria luteobubalina]|uniref:Uncharacterized protein n=1 Tax=Armillaria luteobubalina TaxID=153913 RepID=A0AA39P8W5_9AGAR|nr:hypothetical protein EDD18DRAFT_1440787 [Armillaria luteobubalina]